MKVLKKLENLFKGIIVGIGGVSPGLSGSVLLVIFGLYEKTIEAVGSFFKNIKKNLMFLVPLFAGFGIGILLFSKVVDFLLINYEMYTRFAFLGLIIGTIPMFFKEVKKKGFKKKYYGLMIASFAIGILFFAFSKSNNLFPAITDPNFFQSVILGIALAASTIIPGVDSAVILSSVGLYELYVSSFANLNFAVLLPAGIGLAIGGLTIAFVINKLIKKHYTITFSVIFGLFISIIPSVLTDACYLGFNKESYISIAVMIIAFLVSFFLGKLKKEDVDEEIIEEKITDKISD